MYLKDQGLRLIAFKGREMECLTTCLHGVYKYGAAVLVGCCHLIQPNKLLTYLPLPCNTVVYHIPTHIAADRKYFFFSVDFLAIQKKKKNVPKKIPPKLSAKKFYMQIRSQVCNLAKICKKLGAIFFSQQGTSPTDVRHMANLLK